MGNDLAIYIDRLQSMAFFSGYPLIYAIVFVIAGEKRKQVDSFANRLIKLLPMAYALTGLLFLGLVAKDMFPDYTAKNIAAQFQTPYLKLWGLTALLFWIPVLRKKPVISLLHSLFFLYLLLKDLFLFMNDSIDKEMIQNDMKIYTTSLMINAGTLLSVIFIYLLLNRINKHKYKTSD